MAFDVEVLNEIFGVSGALKDFLATGDMSCWE